VAFLTNFFFLTKFVEEVKTMVVQMKVAADDSNKNESDKAEQSFTRTRAASVDAWARLLVNNSFVAPGSIRPQPDVNREQPKVIPNDVSASSDDVGVTVGPIGTLIIENTKLRAVT
jgi:hypothetical protein